MVFKINVGLGPSKNNDPRFTRSRFMSMRRDISYFNSGYVIHTLTMLLDALRVVFVANAECHQFHLSLVESAKFARYHSAERLFMAYSMVIILEFRRFADPT